MSKINLVERISYAGGLYGILAGSSKGKLQAKVEELNQRGYHLHFIHEDKGNILIFMFRLFLLFITLGIWTIGYSELLLFEKDKE